MLELFLCTDRKKNTVLALERICRAAAEGRGGQIPVSYTHLVVSGQIASNQSARADYINTTHDELPDSGGSGADCFLLLGIGLLALFACCLYIRLYKQKNVPDSYRFSSSSKNK